MFSLDLRVPDDERELVSAQLWECGCAGITEGTETLSAFFEDSADARSLIDRFARYHPVRSTHEERDWVEVSRATWEPLCVGERFYLAPEWRADPTPEGRVRIAINPGLACGTGAHEATRLCLLAVERYLPAGGRVLDVGTGSGILAIAAMLIGGGRGIACDDDPVATAIAAGNLRRAGVRGDVFTGSVDAVRDDVADLAVANISAGAAATLAGDMLRVARRCVASGFEQGEEAGVRDAIEKAGGRIVETAAEGEWRAIVYERASGGAGKTPRCSSSLTASSRIRSSS